MIMSELTVKQQLEKTVEGGLGRNNYDALISEIYDSFRSIDSAHDILHEMRDKIGDAEGEAANELKEKTGIFAYAQGEYQRAADVLSEVKDRKEASHFLGRVLAKLHDFEGALEALDNGRSGDDDFNTDRFRIDVLCVLRQDEEAEKICDRYEDTHGESPDWLYCKGRILETQGQHSEAVDMFEKAVAIDENHQNSLFRLAFNFDLDGEDEKAIDMYNKCASLQPASLGALMNLGVLYEDHQEYEKAIECYERVLAVDPAHKRARLYLKDADAGLHMAVEEDMGLIFREHDLVMDKRIDSFNLSARCRHVLDELQVETVGDLTEVTEGQLMAFNNFGDSSLQELKNILAEHGKSLADEPAQLVQGENAEQEEQNTAGLDTEIEDAGFSDELIGTLKGLGIATLGDLAKYSENELEAECELEEAEIDEVKSVLADNGVEFM